jgi:hypothetical protein
MAATVIAPAEVLSVAEVTWNSFFSILTSSWCERPVLTMTVLPLLAQLLG